MYLNFSLLLKSKKTLTIYIIVNIILLLVEVNCFYDQKSAHTREEFSSYPFFLHTALCSFS